METTVTVVAVVLAAHVLLKFAVFALPYRRRRAALDRSYGDRLSATAVSDAVSLVLALAAAVVAVVAGLDAADFLIGLWVGATLIQVYFHRFHAPLAADQAPPEPTSPIKTMSYAIQAAPWRPWREIVALIVLVVVALVVLAT